MENKNMRTKKSFPKYFVLILVIVNLLMVINNYNINKQRGYYIGKIENIEHKDEITTVEVSPIPSNRYFIHKIKGNHKIQYADNIGITGIKAPNKEGKELYLGQLGETIENLKVGDSIVFKVRYYDKNDYKLEIDELAVDLTLE